MSIFSLAALPAATSVARSAVVGSAQVGTQFLDLLSQVAQPSTAGRSDASEAAGGGVEELPAAGEDNIAQRSQSFGQRLAGWLRRQPWLKDAQDSDQPISIELSLDQLDRPHATLNGQPSPELDEALASDPGWLDEFRTIALDRIEQSGPTLSNSPAQSLTIRQDSATIDAQHRWN